MTARISALFDKAISQERPPKLEFANAIPEVLTTMSKAWHVQHLPLFLVRWLPKRDTEIVLKVVDHLPAIVNVLGSFSELTALIEAMVGGGDPAITDAVAKTISSIKYDESLLVMTNALFSSKIDAVKAFVGRLIPIIPDGEKMKILKKMTKDGSCIVRKAAAATIPDLNDEMAAAIAERLVVNEKEVFIKGYVAMVCSPRSFYFTSLYGKLADDHAWSVRAAVAMGLEKTVNPDSAFSAALFLAEDLVGHIRLCALRSMTRLIPRLTTDTIPKMDKVQEILDEVISYPTVTLKTAAVNCFVVVFKKANDANNTWFGKFVKKALCDDSASLKMHFMDSVAESGASKLVEIVGPAFLGLVENLVASDLWRVRLAVIDALDRLGKMVNANDAKDRLLSICIQCLSDEASQVRDQAAVVLVQIEGLGQGTKLQTTLGQMSSSTTYRERQVAVTLLAAMHRASQKSGEKNGQYLANIKKFLNDKCSNVTACAQAAIESLAQ